ncbi:MAG: hypothetical protein ACFFCI_02375 [Promethearchaeota archaeon]
MEEKPYILIGIKKYEESEPTYHAIKVFDDMIQAMEFNVEELHKQFDELRFLPIQMT